MSDGQNASVNKATYPAPPCLFVLYGGESSLEHDVLWTPPPPITGSFTKFAQVQSDEFLVHDLGPNVPQLYQSTGVTDDINFCYELRRLNRLAATTFIDLLDCLVDRQSEIQIKMETLQHVFLNISHLLNLLRANQARQTIISLLRKQIRERTKRADDIQLVTDQAREYLATHGVEYDEDGELIVSSSGVSLPFEVAPSGQSSPSPVSPSPAALAAAESARLLRELQEIWRGDTDMN